MKKVYSNKISQLIFLFVAIGFILLGIVLHISAIILHKDPVAIYASIIIFPILSLIFWFGYYVEKSSTVEIDNESITFHYFVFTKPKIKYSSKEGLIIKFDNIKKLFTEFHKRDFYFADTTFYYIILNDNTEIKFGLFRLGKKNEKEIYKLLIEYINIIRSDEDKKKFCNSL